MVSLLPRAFRGPSATPRRHARPGVALLLVLGFIALLSLLVTGMMGTLQTRLVEGERRAQRQELRAVADSALAATLARLAVYEIDGDGMIINTADLDRIAATPFADQPPPPGYTVRVLLRDESGRFALNDDNPLALANYFKSLGHPPERAQALAACLIDWTDDDDIPLKNGAEAESYNHPGTPANRPLRSFAELRRVYGFNELFFNADGSLNDAGLELAATATLLDTGSTPHLNGAPEPVIRLLALDAGADSATLLARRTPLDYPTDRKHAGVLRSGAEPEFASAPELVARVAFRARTLRATLVVTKADLRYLVDAVIVPAGANPTAPVRVTKRLDNALLDDTPEVVAFLSAKPDPGEAR